MEIQEEIKKLEGKIEKHFSGDDVMSLASCDKKGLEFKLLQLAKHQQEIKTTQQNDSSFLRTVNVD